MNLKLNYLPSNDKVFGVILSDRELYSQILKSLFGDDMELLSDPITQAHHQDNALLPSMRFDTFAETNKGFYVLDMQNDQLALKYRRNRVMYYSCSLIASQNIEHNDYEILMPAIVTFIMGEAPKEAINGIRTAIMKWDDTNELFSDLLKIMFVYVPVVTKSDTSNTELVIFTRFLSIKTQEEADQFESDYGKTKLGGKLMEAYGRAVFNEDYLKALAKNPYYTDKEYEEFALKREEKGRQDIIAIAEKACQKGMSFEDFIAKINTPNFSAEF